MLAGGVVVVTYAAMDGDTRKVLCKRSNREEKEQPLLTPNEKRAAKRATKHAGDVTLLIFNGPYAESRTAALTRKSDPERQRDR